MLVISNISKFDDATKNFDILAFLFLAVLELDVTTLSPCITYIIRC